MTIGRPVTAKFRRLDSAKLAAAKAEFQQLEREGIVRRSDSDWASPLQMIKKSDGSWRPCSDFRRLNLISEADCYPLPNMADITSSLAGATIFSKLDLKKGYHQIPFHPSDMKKMAIITPFGLFEFLQMPFNLTNARMTFQRFMDRCLAGLPFVLVYLDDILVASPDWQSHAIHLRQVLERLQANGLVLNRAKCEFFRSSVDFLGLHVAVGGVSPLADQVAAIQEFPQPTTVKELQDFLGAVNFYHQFVPAVANILLPLTAFLKGGKKGSEKLVWTSSMSLALTAIKKALLRTVCLAFPKEAPELSLATDASATHVGAVLQQRESPTADWQPLGPPPASTPPPALSSADFVFIKRGAPGPPLSPFYDSPYRALACGPKVFTLELDGQQERVTVDRLKPYLATEVVPAVPPLRGRPLKTSST